MLQLLYPGKESRYQLPELQSQSGLYEVAEKSLALPGSETWTVHPVVCSLSDTV